MLNNLAQRTFRAMAGQGFWDVDHDTEKALSKIALIHTELSEAAEEIRRPDTGMTTIYYRETDGKPEGVPVELADAIIRIADFAGRYGIDLEAAIAEKEAFNRSRPFRHGKTA